MKTLLFVLSLLSMPVDAAQIAAMRSADVTVALFDEPCALVEITNLRRRATWTEGGTVYEGCYGVNVFDIVMMFFSDRTVIAAPTQAFFGVRQI